MSDKINNILNLLINHADEYFEDELEFSDEAYVELNLWRLPIEMLMQGITSVTAEDDLENIRQAIVNVQKTSSEKANWLIYGAMDDHFKVIDLALETYGADVFINGTWSDYPELIQDIPENLPSEVDELKQIIAKQNADMEHLQKTFTDQLREQEKQIEVLSRIPRDLPFGLFQLYNGAASLLRLIAPKVQITSLEMKSDGLNMVLSENVKLQDENTKTEIKHILDKVKTVSLKTCFICGKPANPEHIAFPDTELFPVCDECFEALEAVNYPEKFIPFEDVMKEFTEKLMQDAENDIEKVLIAFDDYLKGSKDIIIQYSEKLGYLLLTAPDIEYNQYIAEVIEDAEQLCRVILSNMKMDYMIENSINELLHVEDKKRFYHVTKPYMKHLPEYEYLLNEIIEE